MKGMVFNEQYEGRWSSGVFNLVSKKQKLAQKRAADRKKKGSR